AAARDAGGSSSRGGERHSGGERQGAAGGGRGRGVAGGADSRGGAAIDCSSRHGCIGAGRAHSAGVVVFVQRRIVVMGKNRIAVECTRVVRAAGDDVVLAVLDPADDGRDTWQPSFRRAAESEGLPTFDPVDINAPSGVARVQAAKPDFVFSFQYAQILKASVISAARIATLNLHFGQLPRYQGVSTIAWALINGEQTTGVTLHHIHRGVDSGDIVCAAPVPIAVTDTGRTLYDKCVDAAISLFADWYPRLRSGDVPRQPQDPTRALYYNRHSLDFKQREVS